jgi:hypothetical protein
MQANGGRVRIKGPVGLSRVARTTVVDAERPCLVTGTADIGRRTRGVVRWEIEPVVPGRSHVRFTAEVERASLPDRVLLTCGGRWWLRRIVRAAVARLGAVLEERAR